MASPFLVYLLLAASMVTSVMSISFREQPESMTVVAGETVKMHCSVNNQVDINLYWQNLDTAAYISLDTRINPYGQLSDDQQQRYDIVGDVDRGEYFLRIHNVSKEDEGRYACVFFLNFNYYSQVAKMRVVRPPDRGYPKCAVEPIKRSNIGDNITLTCESRGGDPPATLSWVRGTTRLVTRRGRVGYDPMVQYSMTLTEDDSDVRFTCVANNPALKTPRTCSLTPLRSSLGVLLRPVVASVEVGQSFTFVCITERMPNLAYQWYINNVPIDGRERRFTYIRGGQRLLIEAVTMEDDYALVKCEVTQKDYSYSGSAVGLLWVQSSNIGTPDITETTDAPPPPKKLSTKGLLATMKAITTTSMATTAPKQTTETTISPVETTLPPTMKRTPRPVKDLTGTESSDAGGSLPEVPLIVNDGNIASYESSSSSSASAYSSVSSLSSEDIGLGQGDAEDQIGNEPKMDVEQASTINANTDTNTDGEIEPAVTTLEEDAVETLPGKTNAIAEDTTPSAEGTSIGDSNAIEEGYVTPSTRGTISDNEIFAGGLSTIPEEIGSGDDLANDIGGGLDMFTESAPHLPNEIGYKSGRLRPTPNWGLIAGLLMVFLLVVVTLGVLAVYLYRRHSKQASTPAST